MNSVILLWQLLVSLTNGFAVPPAHQMRTTSFSRSFSSKPFGSRSRSSSSTEEGSYYYFRSSQDNNMSEDDSGPAAISVDEDDSFYEPSDLVEAVEPLEVDDPKQVEFADPDRFRINESAYSLQENKLPDLTGSTGLYPFALMMQVSAPYIAAHAGKVAVFHIPGDLLTRDKENDKSNNDNFLNDVALAWLLGMKIILVVGCQYDMGRSSKQVLDELLPHESQNTLSATDEETLRHTEEEAGFLRTEIERKLNKTLRQSLGGHSSGIEGNVVSGNFYTARTFGVVRGEDFKYTGFTSAVHVENIQNVLKNDDVVLLTTVGMSHHGDLVNVNGYHLTACVAAALGAYKIVYMATHGCVLEQTETKTHIQEIPLSFAKAINREHEVEVHNTGFATFEKARKRLDPAATELLLHLGWSSWALQNGVRRAHIVNPGDGAILEELFTSKNGANTCIYHDDEGQESEADIDQKDWDAFFASAKQQGQDILSAENAGYDQSRR